MNSRERISATVRGEPVDRPARTMWRHFPLDDETATGLADMTVAFQEMFSWDLIKVCASATYAVEDWGLDVRWPMNRLSMPRARKPIIAHPEDWQRIEPLPMEQGAWAREIAAVRAICRRVPEALILPTVFSPLYTVGGLAGAHFDQLMEENPAVLHRALEVVTDNDRRFIDAVLAEGAHGIFYAISMARKDWLSVEKFQEFGRPYDLRVLERAQSTLFSFMHLHGEALMFTELADYPVHGVNWFDRGTWPSLQEASRLTDKVLLGGIDETRMENMTRQELRDAIRGVAQQVPGQKFIWGPGCVVPLSVSYERIWWMREALDDLARGSL